MKHKGKKANIANYDNFDVCDMARQGKFICIAHLQQQDDSRYLN